MQTRPLDRQRDARRHELEQLDVVAREAAAAQRADVEHADHLIADEQRHAEQRLDPLLAQDRVEHVRVIDVVENHRRPASRHPTGEAATDRDPHTSLHLLFDPHRRARDELVRLLVQQQHRARVRVEDRADARQQDLEQFVELEVGERHVHHRLDVLDPLAGTPLRLEGPCMVDRERCPVGRELEELDVVVAECAVLQHADVEHADHLTADEQRHAEQRLDPLLAQDRVEHVRVIDVVENHRCPASRHPTGEAAPDRDPHTSLHLLFDPHRRARDELVRLLVQQQHRARVHPEQLPRPQEQRREELLQLEMRERRIRERLQPVEPFDVFPVIGHPAHCAPLLMR